MPNPGAPVSPGKDSPIETHQLCTPPLRLNTVKLDELSEELAKRTKETQMLQEEVENATKEAFQKVCCIKNSLQPRFSRDTASVDSDMGSSRARDPRQPAVFGRDVLSLEAVRQCFTFPGKEVLENAVEDDSQRVSRLQRQINETHDHHEQQKFHFLQMMVQLQAALHQVNTEKDFLSHLRMKDSRRHAVEMERAQAALCDLLTNQRSGEEKRQRVEEEACVLSRKAESLEGTVSELYSTLMAHRHGGSTSAGLPTPGSPGQLMPLGRLAVEVLEDLEQERDQLRERLSQVLEQLKSEELNHQAKAEVMLKEQQDRMEQLIAGHDQQVAMLTEKLNSNAILLLKLERHQKHAERQESFHNCQVKELDSVLSIHKDRVNALEQQLSQTRSEAEEARSQAEKARSRAEKARSQAEKARSQAEEARSQAEEAQRGREQSLKQIEELHSQLGQLTEELRQAQEELGGERERCRRLQERSRELQAEVEELRKELAEHSVLAHHLHSLAKQDCLAQMEALRSREWQQEESGSLREQLGTTREEEEKGRRRSQMLLTQRDEELRLTQQAAQQGRAGLETLQKRLEGGERAVQVLRPHQESAGGQMMKQRGRVVDDLRREKRRLGQRIVQYQLELRHLQASVSEQGRRVQELTQEREQLSAQLDRQRTPMFSLSGLKVARDMQRQMTARRQHMDALQSRIQQLEETMAMLHQEERCQNQGTECELQELAKLREQKRQLAVELEALSSRETQHRDKVRELETALHKMSVSFADCQHFLHLQEQDSVRLKLQHALDLKELQGCNLRSAATVDEPPPSTRISSLLSAPAAQHHPWHDNPDIKSAGLQDSAARERASLARELQHGVMAEKPRPHASQHRGSPSRKPPRRRSAPKRGCGTTPNGSSSDPPQEVRGQSELNTYRRKLQLPGRSDLQEDRTDSPFSCEKISSVIRGYTYKTSPE